MTQLPLPDYDISDLIAARQWHTLRRWFAALNPSDTAELFSEVSLEEEGLAFRLLSPARTVQVFSYLPPDHQERLIRELPDQQLRHIVNAMTDDDRTRLIEEMPTSVTLKVLAALSPDELRSARELLGYPEDTAGRYMTPDYVSLRPEMTARQALEHIRRVGRGKETLNVLYIVDEHGGLVEDLRLGSLVLADPERSILVIQDPPLVSVRATDDREEVLQLFEKYDRVALPVTDPAGKMLGIITVDDILDVAQQEATEDIQKLGGSAVLDAPYLKVSLWEMIRKRAGWLAVLFIGEMLTATAMGFFQGEIARAVVLTLFIPLIISSGGNSGSQATTLIIRS
ncbi:MAG: magnesium transporter, partial [Acidobacteriota bacterium]